MSRTCGENTKLFIVAVGFIYIYMCVCVCVCVWLKDLCGFVISAIRVYRGTWQPVRTHWEYIQFILGTVTFKWKIQAPRTLALCH